MLQRFNIVLPWKGFEKEFTMKYLRIEGLDDSKILWDIVSLIPMNYYVDYNVH